MTVSAQSAPGLLQQRSFVLFWTGRVASSMAYQMLALVIGWQVYELTDSAFDLGLVGLIQFVPGNIRYLIRRRARPACGIATSTWWRARRWPPA